MSKKTTKAKTAGNEKPASGMKAVASALMARIASFAAEVVTLRDKAQVLLLDCGWHAMEYGNLKPMTALIKKSEGLHRKGMIALAAAAFGVKAEKDKDTGEERIVADKAFNDFRTSYKTDKLAFAKRARGLGNYWTFAPDKAFEGIDLIKLLNAAVGKAERASKDETKKDKVKGLEHVAAVKAFLATLKTTDEDEGGEQEASEDTGTIELTTSANAGEGEHATIM